MPDIQIEARDILCGDRTVTRHSVPMLRERYDTVTHESGLKVAVFPKRAASGCAMLSVRFGAQDSCFALPTGEYQTPRGVAHFLEHKLFTGEDGHDVNEKFSDIGAESNAWTDHEKTVYLFESAENFPQALALLLDFVTHPYFTEEGIRRERGIIDEEIRAGLDDAWEALYEGGMRAMYAAHPVRYRICGSSATIAKITPQCLYDSYYAFYRPENMTLTVCAEMETEQVLAVCDRVLRGWNERCAAHMAGTHRQYRERPEVVHRRLTCYAPVAKPLFQIGFKDTDIPQNPQERLRRETAMNLVSEIAFSRAGDFYSRLFERGMITPGYSYGYSVTSQFAYHAVTGECDCPEQVLEAYFRALERLDSGGIPEEDLERSRRVLYADFVSDLDFPEDIAELLVEAQHNGYPLFEPLHAIRTIGRGEIAALLHTMRNTAATALTVVQNKKEQGEDTNELG